MIVLISSLPLIIVNFLLNVLLLCKIAALLIYLVFIQRIYMVPLLDNLLRGTLNQVIENCFHMLMILKHMQNILYVYIRHNQHLRSAGHLPQAVDLKLLVVVHCQN